jgi:hypothetical protein
MREVVQTVEIVFEQLKTLIITMVYISIYKIRKNPPAVTAVKTFRNYC